MRLVRFSSLTIGWLVVVGVWCAVVTAQGPIIDIKDMAMGPDGQVHGMVVDSSGIGVPGVPVSLRLRDQEVASVTTDQDGRFAFRGIKGGVYQFVTPQDSSIFRVWLADAAPPTAGDMVVLRQNGPYQLISERLPAVENPASSPASPDLPAQSPQAAFGRPLLIGAAVATAVAVPITLANQRRPHSP